MTEQEWLDCSEPAPLLVYLQTRQPNAPRWGDRIQRLLGCAFCRRFWHLLPHAESRKAVEVAERFADGLAREEELNSNWSAAFEVFRVADPDDLSQRNLETQLPWVAAQSAQTLAFIALHAVTEALRIAALHNDPAAPKARQELCGLIREIRGNPFRPASLDPSWLSWHGGLLVSMAGRMYDSRDFSDMPVLADALEEAGCRDTDILAHCRSKGEHVRGCWVVDLLLGRG